MKTIEKINKISEQKNENFKDISFDKYLALEKVLKSMSQDDVIEEIKKSGLRGRGGAGFPTGQKWKLAKNQDNKQKYVICNADEGDPEAYKDINILEENPHCVLEAMIIAGYAVGANKGYIYLRCDYKVAVNSLKIAVSQAREHGMLGKNILGSGFNFNIEIKLGADAFICGEETALIETIEGRRGHPKVKPTYPVETGLWGNPTIINNVETFTNISNIILNGAEAFNQIGTENSKGTKFFVLCGNVKDSGLVEVPMGTSLRKIIYDFGGGIPNDKEFKAAQIGGPTGGFIPKEHLDTPLDYETLKNMGSMMGSGRIVVIDETKCILNLVKFYLDFAVSESCGKCTPCRIGTKRMQEILEKICDGDAEELDIYRLEKLATNIKETSICSLGKSSANMVLSSLKYFKDEYKEHVIYKQCRCMECKNLKHIKIAPDKCKGCGLCQKNCPVNAIEGEGRDIRKINQKKCIKCDTCLTKCPFGAII